MMATSDEILEDLLRLKVIELRSNLNSQSELILEMSKVGFSPSRIATLLGTTAGTVSTALQRSKKSVKSTKKVGSKDSSNG